jgi:hypothetical protein
MLAETFYCLSRFCAMLSEILVSRRKTFIIIVAPDGKRAERRAEDSGGSEGTASLLTTKFQRPLFGSSSATADHYCAEIP